VERDGYNERNGYYSFPTSIKDLAMRRMGLVMLALILVVPCLAEDDAEEGWIPLFDGKTLAGWEGNEKMFRVEDEAIVAGTLERDIPHNDFLCTEKEFGDFELRLSVKLLGKGDNAGIQVRSRRVPDDHEVSGYQADVGSAWDRPVWGALYDEARRNKILSDPGEELLKDLVKPDDWNELRIRCEGPRIQIWLNGKRTVDYTEEDEGIARSGVIGLQVHGGPPAEAWYKDIAIRELD
jgi:hypothetical protein